MAQHETVVWLTIVDVKFVLWRQHKCDLNVRQCYVPVFVARPFVTAVGTFVFICFLYETSFLHFGSLDVLHCYGAHRCIT